jgi:uncharacterized repeat protein (TIGR03803 family)
MAHPTQHRGWIDGANLRMAIASMAVAILIITASHIAVAQTFTALHGFNGMPDGATPIGGLTMDRAGNFYGTTQYGGADGYGMVFKLVHTGSTWIMHPLYSFPSIFRQGANDGAEPMAGVTIGPDGNLYGTNTLGSGSSNFGTVFKLSPPASVCRSTMCPWTETILYRFTGASDGGVPSGPVIFDRNGNLYGNTSYGGVTCGPGYSCGVVFKLTRSGSSWTESVLHAFSGSPDGANPGGALVFDRAGNLYGTAGYGGSANDGAVFQLTPSGSGWTENVIHNFDYFDDGAIPQGGVIFDNAGNLFGTTVFATTGDGTVFELTPSGGQWTYTLLYSLMSEQSGIPGPLGPLAMDSGGNLYGMTFEGGDVFGAGDCEYGCGTVFKLTPAGGGWAYSLLYEFMGGTDGARPYDGVILDRNGNLYGTASTGGERGQGTVFEITP